VDIAVPQRGEKAELVEGALRNGPRKPRARMSESATRPGSSTGSRKLRPPRAAAADRGLRQLAHHGTERRGRLHRLGPDGFEKGQYRKFNIETAKPATTSA
jgi:excinuclease ABC subunit C